MFQHVSMKENVDTRRARRCSWFMMTLNLVQHADCCLRCLSREMELFGIFWDMVSRFLHVAGGFKGALYSQWLNLVGPGWVSDQEMFSRRSCSVMQFSSFLRTVLLILSRSTWSTWSTHGMCRFCSPHFRFLR